MAGAIFGQVSVILECNFAVFVEVGMSLSGAGAGFPEIFGQIPEREMYYFSKKMQNASPRWDGEALRGGGAEMTSPRFDYGRIIVESRGQNFVGGTIFGALHPTGWSA